MYIKQYDNKTGEHTGYRKENTYYTLGYSLPESAEVDEGEQPTESELLEVKKQAKKDEVNAKTSKLILEGFEYQSKLFDFSRDDQMNYAGLDTKKDRLDYENLVIFDKDNDMFPITSQEDLSLFTDIGMKHKNDLIISGQTIKAQIKACTSIDELESIIDDR